MDEDTRQTLIVTFNITGRLKYLSHQETSRMFERAFIRSGICLRFSDGYNPHPKMSLPLPRTVSVASEGDIVCAGVSFAENEQPELKSELQKQLPVGCEVVNVEIAEGKAACQPRKTDYVFVIEHLAQRGKIKEQIEMLQKKIVEKEELVIERWSEKKKRFRNIDVSNFINEVNINGDEITVKVNITHEGTIRVNEVLALSGVGIEDVRYGVTRRNTVFIFSL